MFFIEKIVNRKKILSKVKTPYLLITVLALLLVQCTQKSVREPSSVKRNPTAERVTFEQCSNEKRLYLEPALALMSPEYLTSNEHQQDKRIPIKCVQFAQRNFSGHYAQCASEEARPTISSNRPCMSEPYVMLSYNAYHDVMDCFNLDPREFYLQIMIESGFHINAINKTGFDSGISQFTANGIKRVTANNLVERTRRVLLESSRPSCQRISSVVGHFNVDAFSVQKRCSMISLPKNPYRAMLFNYLHTMLDQITLDRALSDLPEVYDVLTPRLKRQLTYLAYNRGMTGTKRLLSGYAQNRKQVSHQITEQDLDLNQNLSQVKKILRLEPSKREALKKAKIRNMSFAEYAVIHGATYVSDMAAAGDYVQRHMGNSCGEM
ncbi:hypothetical protein [Pseudobdellovibrio exovorus]|uniref:hypothetical protein n=1 Tax=Pseudobdellovibrio exovorus TaxID=453816 RepID=UPI000345CC28|nr:hypothetical protein [Pseudobdellovibrio exovorus]